MVELTVRSHKLLLPPACIGIIGGGQLGRMITFEAKRMGYKVIILDPTSYSPAGQVADEQITASFTNRHAVKKLAERCDVLTYEFEHIDADMLQGLEAEGYNIYPSGRTLKALQDKYMQKAMLKKAGIPVPDFFLVNNRQDIADCIETLGYPIVIKTRFGGYDGRGNYVIRAKNQIDTVISEFAERSLMVERYINFERELSVIVVRDQHSNCSLYPVVENVHEDSILRITRAPADLTDIHKDKICEICNRVMETIDDVGIFCIELFLSRDGLVYINEIAPRPHNSGHYSIEACVTSQYEQLVRIITGMPLGSANLLHKSVMVNILGNDDVTGRHGFSGIEEILKEDNVYLHLYGKQLTQKQKKLGHITVLDHCIEVAERKAVEAIRKLEITARR